MACTAAQPRSANLGFTRAPLTLVLADNAFFPAITSRFLFIIYSLYGKEDMERAVPTRVLAQSLQWRCSHKLKPRISLHKPL